MPDVTLLRGDCLHLMPTLADASVDAIVTDPPYGISFMGKEWDGPDGIAFRPEIWRECLRVLKPGGHLLAFGGTRMHHRLTVAIEDAGFQVRDMLAWVHGQGFPKGSVVDGWGPCLKPALEPITLARKSLQGTVAANVLAHGTGALNIDGCRVETSEVRAKDSVRAPNSGFGTFEEAGGSARSTGSGANHAAGRFPANLIHDGSDEVEAAFAAYGETSTGGQPQPNGGRARQLNFGMSGGTSRPMDRGTASRFFYSAKASKADRGKGNDHPTVKPTALMRYLCRLITPTGGTILDPFMGSGSTGRGAALEGFGFIGIEREPEYHAIAERRINAAQTPLPMAAE